ncbi:MAG: ABC transporter ATP-binding protein [Christensenellales bacterium]|jgi:branched-chain amino acid transport system ATP-binding protein
MLKVNDINVYYGAIHALHGISFEVRQGEIVSLIGANGAGKSTTLNAISSLLPIASGDIIFMDQSIRKTPAFQLVGMGLAQVPEGRRVFSRMTVLENLEMGAFARKDSAQVNQDLELVFGHFPRLKERRRQVAGTLSGGEQQMLAMGRAMMSRPKLLMMDEPSMGLSPILVQEIFAIIKHINQDGMTILLVEQNAHMALNISDRAYVLETGNLVKSGPSQELLVDADVQKAYLGT